MTRRVTSAQIRAEAEAVLQAAWREPGFCVPNGEVYPHQWLWDSCFHALAWSSLGSGRGVREVENALSAQADDGFVPHMIYWHHPDLHADFWGLPNGDRPARSAGDPSAGTTAPTGTPITQPPMYGHALAVLADCGDQVPDDLVDRACRGILHLAARPRTGSGLVPVLHPWETGCDDSPRWDHRFDDGGAEQEWHVDRLARQERKKAFVDALHRSPAGHGLYSDAFAVGSIGFNALVAWNALELARAFPDRGSALTPLAAELIAAIGSRWDGVTWVDDWSRARSPEASPVGRRSDVPRSGWASDEQGADPFRPAPVEASVRTADALLALLVDPRAEAFEQLADPAAFAGRFGPRGVDQQEPAYRPDQYWRGSTWPQLVYLLVQAAKLSPAAAPTGLADTLAQGLIDGATNSGWAEYWHPDTGEGYGARPQSWATLAVTVLDF